MSGNIPPKVFKEYGSVCCKPLTKVTNNGILNSVFDSDFKCADITPIHEVDDTTNG